MAQHPVVVCMLGLAKTLLQMTEVGLLLEGDVGVHT